MKRLFTSLKVLCLTLLLLFNFNVTAGAQSFKDLTSKHWAYNAVSEMTNLGVINGYTDGTFKPSNHVTRAEFAKLLVVTLDLDGTKVTNPLEFEDVKDTYWGYNYIKSAGNYLTGYKVSDKYYFYPTKDAVREDMAVAMVVASGLSNVDYSEATLNKFSDINKASSGIKKYIAIAVEHGLMKGNANGTFNPKGTLTRAEAAQLMLNFVKSEKVSLEDLEKMIDANKEGPILHEKFGYIDLGPDYAKYEYEDDGVWHKATFRYLHKSSNKESGTCNNFYFTDVTIREINNPSKTYSFKIPYVNSIQASYDKDKKEVDLGENWHAYDILSLDVEELSKAPKSDIKWVKAPERIIKKGSTYFDKAYLFIRYEEKDKTKLTSNIKRVGELEEVFTWKETTKNIDYKGSDYKITEENGKVYLTIGLGSRSNGGYTIEITNVKISGKNITVDVQETTPNPQEKTTQSITYPHVTIELSGMPDSVKINKLTPKVRQLDSLTWKASSKEIDYNGSSYKITEEGGKVYLTVGIGSRATTGYTLEIANVEITGKDVVVDVQETKPNPGELTTKSTNYPRVTIELSGKPNSVKVNKLTPKVREIGPLTWKASTKEIDYTGSSYKVTEEDGKVYLTVGLGSRTTTGYTIDIANVKITDRDIVIDVQETKPNPNEATTKTTNYPHATIELNYKPNSVKINKLTPIVREIDALTWKETTKTFEYRSKGYQINTDGGKTYLTVGLGERPSGGYTVEISNVKIEGGKITLDVQETAPAADAITTQSLTYPSATIEVSRKPDEVVLNYKPVITPQAEELTWKETTKTFSIKSGPYAINEEDGKTYLTVGIGERSTGGYSVKIVDVRINGGDIELDIQEIMPGLNEGVTQAFTYPTATIEVSRRPDSVKINKLTPIRRGDNTQLTWSDTSKKITYKGNSYLITEEDGKVYLTVGMGEKNHGGYGIEIVDVKIKGQDVTLEVLETYPDPWATTASVINYPTDTIELSGKPKNVMINKVTKKTQTEEPKLTWSTSTKNISYKSRGYTITEEDGKVYLTVGLGSRSTGGYSVSIEDVTIEGYNVTVDARETMPGFTEMVTQAFTYPTKTIELSGKPEKVTINWLESRRRGEENKLYWYYTDQAFSYEGNGYTINKKDGKIYVTIGKAGETAPFDLLLNDVTVEGKKLKVSLLEAPRAYVASIAPSYSSNLTLRVSIEPEDVEITYITPDSEAYKNLSYSIIGNYLAYNAKGYKHVTQDNAHYVVVGGGKQKNVNMKVDITSIDVNGKRVDIYAQLVPDTNSNVMVQYPATTIRFSEKPISVLIHWDTTVFSMDTGLAGY